MTTQKSKAKKSGKLELPPLDETTTIIAGELLKNISPVAIEVNSHFNKKTVVISESAINQFMSINIKLAQLNEVQDFSFSFLDDNIIEIDFEVVKYASNFIVAQQLKIDQGTINSREGVIKFSYIDAPDSKGEHVTGKILQFLVKYILQTLFLPAIIKQFKEEKLLHEKDAYTFDLKDGQLKLFYDKTINQVLTTNVPLLGHKHLPEMFEIESIRSEKGELWLDLMYQVV